MFHKTVLRLTGLYLVIIMSISILFSSSVYVLATHEIDRGLRRQGAIFTESPPDGSLIPSSLQRRFIQNRDEVSIEAKAHIFANLLLANLGILVLAGGLSYVLAKQSLEPIEEAHRSLEQFTADASHELRTPIAAMKSEIEVTLMQPKITDKESRTLLRSNLEEIDSLTRLTGDLLSLARLEELKLHLVRHQLKPVVNTALKKLADKAVQKNITLTATYAQQDISAVFDKPTLIESLIILLDNAIKYGDPQTTVEILVERKRDKVIIAVSNTGVGIDKDSLPYVFDRFYRADGSRTQPSQGHGLGLAIAKQLLERQHASIHITSDPGVLTTATVTLPARA